MAKRLQNKVQVVSVPDKDGKVVKRILVLSQADYDALSTKDEETLYFVTA